MRVKTARRLLGMPFGSGPLESEEGRAFLQQRLALVALVGFCFSAFAFVMSHIITPHGDNHPFLLCMREHGGYWHLSGAGISLLVWLLTRRGRLGHASLITVDVVGTFLVVSAYAFMAGSGIHKIVNRADLVLLLTCMVVLITRAIVVPSTLWHTVLVSTAGMLPVLVLAHYTLLAAPEHFPNVTPAMAVMSDGVWAILGISVAGLASRVVYNLRAEAAAARRLGQYVLDEKIGEGGMGAVYRARHALLRRPTAVKLVLPERAGSEALARFEREVQLTAQLSHPNTVGIFDYGRSPDGVFYYAMEYLDGIDLESLVERFGPQDPSRVVHILAQVASSLAEAHAIGLVHRDVKPANVILCERGGVPDVAKVVDFGLVKDVARLGRGDPSLSNVDTLLGTPLYLSPESLLSPATIDGRADLYALGAVGYFLLTGRPVFDGSSVMEVCAQHLHAVPVPPSERLGRELPAHLERLILACLAKKPEQRPETARALRDALLALDVPAWTEERARAWWREHADAARRSLPTPVQKGERDTVAIDFNARAAG
jgi:serine/threonine-protein kinase